VNRVWAGCQISSTRRCVAAGRACALSSRRRRADATVALVRPTVVWKWGAAASRWAPAACAVPLPLPALPPCSRRQRFFFSARSPSHGPETASIFFRQKIFSLPLRSSTPHRNASHSPDARPLQLRRVRAVQRAARGKTRAAMRAPRSTCAGGCAFAARTQAAPSPPVARRSWPRQAGRGPCGGGEVGANARAMHGDGCRPGARSARSLLRACTPGSTRQAVRRARPGVASLSLLEPRRALMSVVWCSTTATTTRASGTGTRTARTGSTRYASRMRLAAFLPTSTPRAPRASASTVGSPC